MVRVADVMTREVVTLSPDDSLKAAVEKLSSRGISGAPVVENGKVVGILSLSDILSFLGRRHLMDLEPEDLEKLRSARVREVMKKKVITVGDRDPVSEAVRLMTRHGVNRLPVVSGGKLVGIIARADIVRYLSAVSAKRKAGVSTGIDRLLDLVRKSGSVTLDEAARKLSVPLETLEKWASILDEHGLVEFHAPPFGKPELRKVEP